MDLHLRLSMKNIGLLVTVAYVAVTYGAAYISAHTGSLHAVGVGDPAIDLIAGALQDIGRAIATIALTIGLALPAIRGEPIVSKDEVQPRDGAPAHGGRP